MPRQTIIDYSGQRVRLMEFDGSGKKLRVLGVTDVALNGSAAAAAAAGDEGEAGAEAGDAQAAAIRKALREAKFTNDPCAMAFDASNAMFREFDLPFTNDDQIAKVVRFESESHVPGDIDAYVLQHLVLRKTRDKSHILVIAVKKDELLDRLDILDESGLDPMVVDIDDLALHNALVATGVAGEHARMAVINAQEHATSLLFLEGGKLVAVRSIRIGSRGVGAQAVEPGAEAAADGGEGPAAGEAAADAAVGTARAHEYLSRLKREIRRTVSTLPDALPVDALYVAGPGGAVPGFAQAIGEVLGGEPEPLDLLERVSHELSDEEARRWGPELGVALGMAFKLNGHDVSRTDFRREEAAYTHKFDQVKTPLIVLSFLVFLVVAFLGLDAYMEAGMLRTEYDRIVTQGDVYLGGILGDAAAARAKWEHIEPGPRRVKAVLDAVKGVREEIAQKLGRSKGIPDLQSALEVWIELSNTIFENEAAIGRLALQRIDIDVLARPPQIKLDGQVEDLTHFATLQEVLRQRPMFAEVEPGSAQPVADGVRFSDLVIKLSLGAKTDAAAKERS
ncbi:MAG TPA: pilus assembly protein PilM [Planctomycetota bacterium]|nr:pilus assembly protein PilM [Planctomycetota bacterium]